MNQAVVRYRRYLRLLKLWPVSVEHRARYIPTLDQHLAQRVHAEFEEGKTMTPEDCDRNLDSLERLLKNSYKTKYGRGSGVTTGAFNKPHEVVKKALDDNFEQLAKRQDRVALLRSVFMPDKAAKD